MIIFYLFLLIVGFLVVLQAFAWMNTKIDYEREVVRALKIENDKRKP